MDSIETVIADVEPDLALVYGNTNSTLAGALAAAQHDLPVAHVEAGLRSFDRAVPPGGNRVPTGPPSAVLLCPSPTAADNLLRGHPARRGGLGGDAVGAVAPLFSPRPRPR